MRWRWILFLSGAVFMFGIYLLLGGLLAMIPHLGAGPQSADDLVDRPVAAWLWWVGGICAVAGLVSCTWLASVVNRYGIEPLERPRILAVLFWTTGIAEPVVGTLLTRAAVRHSDLRGRIWWMPVLCAGILVFGAVKLAVDRRRRPAPVEQ